MHIYYICNRHSSQQVVSYPVPCVWRNMGCKSASISLLNLIMYNKLIIVSVSRIVVHTLYNVSMIVHLLHRKSALAIDFDGSSHLCLCLFGLQMVDASWIIFLFTSNLCRFISISKVMSTILSNASVGPYWHSYLQ